ncbi:MAG: methyltransferase domain-containing protein [Bacteroidetes bacterium]|nr:methyltransferase domain-containing protein [Bacteroidota bacterium]
MKRSLILLSLFFAFAGCRHHHSDGHQHDQGDHSAHEEHHEDNPGQGDGSAHKEHHHDANEFMHQSSIDELIERFESPERDAYQQPEKVLEYLGDLSGKKIMDIGAGSGYFSFRLVNAGAQVIAADVEDGFLQYMKTIKDSTGLADDVLELRKIPYDDPQLQPGEVDMALVVNTYHHIKDRPEYFKKVLAGLKSEGELIIIDFFKKELPVGPPPAHKISEDQVVVELIEAGFSQFDMNDTLLEYQFILRAEK